MDAATKAMVQKWIAMHRGDKEAVARWMGNVLRKPLRDCRRLVEEAGA
jgi:hypothetical protein